MESGNGITLMVIFGLAYLLIGESMLTQLLKLSGATKLVFFFAQQYAGIILVGMPFLIITNMMIDAIVNTILVMKTNAIILAIVVGISQGVQPIIGFNYGAEQYARVREAYLPAIKWNMIVSTIGFFLLQCFPQQIISLFGDGDKLYLEFAVLFMRIYLFILMLPLRFGIMGVLFAGPIADFAAFILSVVLVSKELRKQKIISQKKNSLNIRKQPDTK